MRLDGTHTLTGGSFSGSGTLQFNGTNTIIDQPVTINCLTLDLDGPGGAKQVYVNAAFTINSDKLDLADSNFDATLNIGASPAALHVTGPSSWIMAGTLNQTTGSNAYVTSLTGAPVTISGTANVSGSTGWDARASISGSVNLPNGADRLELRGGSVSEPNRLPGGTISGGGVLRAFNARLTGFGTVSTKLDFTTGSALLADDGLLRLNGSFLTVPPVIGTADGDGILEVMNAWTLPAGKLLKMNGGIVRGGTLDNEGTIGGYGTLRSNDLINNGTISAEDGQTLVIDIIGSPDLDGLATPAVVAGHLLEAVHGNVTVTKAPGDAFGATLTIGAGRTATFMGGWTLDAPGTLHMTGASLAGSTAILRGTVNVTDQCHCLAPALFAAGSATSLATNATLRMESNATVEAAAAFSGAGRLVVANGSTLSLAPAANVGASLVNESGRIELASSPGVANAAEFTQTAAGTLAVEVLGAPASTAWDQLTVTGSAALDGTLEVTFSVAGAQQGDTWKVLGAGSLTGSFSQMTALGVPAGYQLLMLQTADGVYLKLSALMTCADWALAAGLTPRNNDVAADPDGDQLENGLEMFLGGNPLKPEFSLMLVGGLVKVDGLHYLSITLPIAVATRPADLKLGVLRSTDLTVWKQEDTVIEVTGYDPGQCLEFRRFRSAIPFDSLPREYLKLHVTAQ